MKKQVEDHKSEDVTDQSRVAGTSARRVDEQASASAVLDGQLLRLCLGPQKKAGPARVVAPNLSDPTGALHRRLKHHQAGSAN